MTRKLGPISMPPHGKRLLAGEPLIFHCNYYNYWLQKTLLLDPEVQMAPVIQNAATSSAYAVLSASVKAHGDASRREIAENTFAELGFGTIDLSSVDANGGVVRVPVSHYGACLRQACGADFAEPQSHFDAGYAAAAAAVIHGLPAGAFEASIEECQSMGAREGRIALKRAIKDVYPSCGVGAHWAGSPQGPNRATSVKEEDVLAALATLDLSGNEEGLIPRFGVMLTNHLGNFYNRISFEYLRRMENTGLLEAAETLLVEAGHRCAFHTFGGIMESAEWDAVVRPSCKTREDWVHGIVACINALGWGVWRVMELSERKLVMRVYDDYESSGWRGMYGKASRPVSYLATGGTCGIMSLVYTGNIMDRPTLDASFYEKVFNDDGSFRGEQVKSFAMGDDYTEIVATR